MSSIHDQRWEMAQRYEKDWWEKRTTKVNCGFYQSYAIELLSQLDGLFKINDDTSILEIGSGAAGIITFLKSNHRYAIDPLEYFYSTVQPFVQFRDPKVKYQTAKAEHLPFKDDQFQLIVVDNVLDHCDDVNTVFREMNRVLMANGMVYLRLNVYTRWGKMVRFFIERFKIDQGHPYTFNKSVIIELCRDHGFLIKKTVENGYWRTWLKEIKSVKLKEILKAISFSTPNKTLFILEKQ